MKKLTFRETPVRTLAPYLFLALVLGAIVARLASSRVEGATDGFEKMLAETIFLICLAGSIFTFVLLIVHNVFLLAVIRRSVLRSKHPDAVVFSAFNAIRHIRMAKSDILKPAGPSGLTVSVTVDSEGWTIWRGVFRPRRIMVIDEARIISVAVGSDDAGAPGVILLIDKPTENMTFSPISEFPSGFRRTEALLAVKLVESLGNGARHGPPFSAR